MIFRKPYAFFIKYFRIINLVLVLLFGYLGYKLNLIREVISDIYNGSFSNYSNLNSTYIGFKLFLTIFLICFVVGCIILLLKKKKKPINDYLFSLIYVFIIIIYCLFMSNIFFTLNETIIEQTSLRLYSDIAFLIIVPLAYFLIKFILITIGFNIKKFNFSQDIIELKQDEKDNEEIEVIFDKNTYKYKRKLRKTIREFKYYLLENKIFIGIIVGVLVLILIISFSSSSFFNNNKVKKGKDFVASGFNYKVIDVYETVYDSSYNIVKKDYKFVIAKMLVTNISNSAQSIDFKRIRLQYKDENVYPNDYFNKFFIDLGTPYDKSILSANDTNEFIFIFKVPSSYKSNKYTLKFYDNFNLVNDELRGNYKKLKLSVTKLSNNPDIKNASINESVLFNKSKYGNSSFSIINFDVRNSYIFNNNGTNEVIRDNDINKILLILNYKLEIDNDSSLTLYNNNDIDFFDKFITVAYTYNGKEKTYTNVKVIGKVDGKIMMSVPSEVKNSSELFVILNFRDTKILYKLK